MTAVISSILSAELKVPSGPEEPVMNSDLIISDPGGKYFFDLTLKISGRADLVGRVNFGTPNFYASVENKGRELFYLKDLKSITVRKWSPEKKGKRTFVYYPRGYEFILRNGRKISVSGNIPLFNVIKLNSKGKRLIRYSYFYDYIKDGKWENRKKEESSIEADTPVAGCINVLELNQ